MPARNEYLANPRDLQRRANVERLKKEQINDGCFSVLVIMISVMYGLSGPICQEAPLKMWVDIEITYYVASLLFVWAYYQYLKRMNRESWKWMVANCLMNLIHCGWLIYGNIMYFKFNEVCYNELKNTDSRNLTWIMLAQIIIGYIPLIKCCSLSTLVICFAPTFLRAIRRAQRPDADWVPTGRDIMKNIYKEKFSSQDHPEGLECAICMEEYQPDDEITPLPCDTRHFFHTKCIEDWLKHNNSCPLCKKPVTLNDLKN